MKKQTLLITLSLLFSVMAYTQNDSLILINGDKMIGEVKAMDRGVVTFKTAYSDKDFQIEWDGIKEIYTVTNFLISFSDGRRYNGHVETVEPGKIAIITDEGEKVEIAQDDIVFMDDTDDGFWSQIYFSFDVGFDLTKANNFNQISVRSNLGYTAKLWNIDANYNTLFSSQDEIEDIKRTDGDITYKYFLPKDWYPLIATTFLSNTEQALKLRSAAKLGMGKFIIHTNKSYWGFSAGGNYNNEIFSIDTVPDKKSWEGFLGTELNLFDIGDLTLSTKIFAYPGITEAGRWRADFNFDARYEMPFDDDFYISMGVTFNYDNQPIESTSETDYVLHTGFGWSW
jgi:hypothetical protein